MAAQIEPGTLPCCEVVTGCDGTANALTGPHRPELRERSSPNDGGCVDAPLHPDLVAAAVRVKGAKARLVRVVGRVVHTKVLHDIVLHEGVCGPAVQREIGVAVADGLVGSRVVEFPLNSS